MAIELAKGYTLRNATWDDIEGVANVIMEASKANGDAEMVITADDLAVDWRTPGFNLATDCWVVTDPTGLIVGTEEFINRFEHCALAGDGYVHPRHFNNGIGSTMLRALVERAKDEIPLAKPDMRVYLRNGIATDEVNAVDIHKDAGFSAVRYHWRMNIDLAERPVALKLPKGIEFRPFDVDAHDHQLYLAHHDAFKDHWGHTLRPYDFWVNNVRGFKEFDPSMWLVAWDGNEIAGYALNRNKPGTGWVATFGVRRQWRKRGLGLAMLIRSFEMFYDRGITKVGLTVDAANPTGATRLYQKAGMTQANEYIVFEKEFRAGIEPADL